VSLLLQALKKAEQRNVDVVGSSDEAVAASALQSARIASKDSPEPVFPKLNLELESLLTTAVGAVPPITTEATAPANNQKNLDGLSLLDTPEPQPASGQPERQTESVTSLSTESRRAATSATASSSSYSRMEPGLSSFMNYNRTQAESKSRRKFRWLAYSVTVLCVVAFASYLMLGSYLPKPVSTPSGVFAVVPQPVVSALGSAAVVADAPGSAPLVAQFESNQQKNIVQPTSSSVLQPESRSPAVTAGVSLDRQRTSITPSSLSLGPVSAAVAIASPRTELSLRRELPAARTEELDLAYQDLSRGQWEAAERRYRALLVKDRQNPDIWTGLGAAVMRAGQIDEAESMFRRALELNPGDVYARAMLLSLSRSIDPHRDSQFATLANQTTGSATIQAAVYALLGAEHAAARRWGEAQQAYFNALAADPVNPDYAYNMAVILEHMRQPRLAYDFYKKALEFSKLRSSQFELSRVESRLSALKPVE
jgi:Tfp pilus assembly protein PilF